MGNPSVPLLLIVLYVTLVTCEHYVGDDISAKRINSLLTSDSEANNFDSDENALDKRHERYGFGLGRRSYVLTTNSQGKRLPSYDFGLGKRSRYSFGLGKRTFEEDYPESEYALNFLTSNLDDPNIKRGRPYSFGLGKRAALRNNDQRYNFGLGKR
ncbi:helicostatins [Hermetia illucens]|uniref:helicostatins n=1 Tax=Hermetia illucens TaxID=343691 RepID=UPI0018CC54E9|nr:helicostatins [Hermetia illucens]XP_037913160.1 helicostatins [Hermetia illucens]XP_037913161.1 helicostatins [Hermetia illucens]XP_037913162.1 helicostatins [Hermetia illucens]